MIRRMGVVACVSLVAWLGSASADDSYWHTVELQGNANLTLGNLSGSAGTDSDANTSIGAYAAHEDDDGVLSVIGAFSFGAKGRSIAATSVNDYVAFLQQPASTLGGQVKAGYAWYVLPKTLLVGLAMNARAFTATFTVGDSGVPQPIALVALDPSVTVTAVLDTPRGLTVSGEFGLATRFWNKPGSAFTSALDIADSHAYAGPRAAAFISIGNIYAGIEMTRYFGQDGLEPLREFAIMPLVGVRGALDLKTVQQPAPPPAPGPIRPPGAATPEPEHAYTMQPIH